MEKYVLKLDTPLEYGSKKIESLEFDFSKLTGNDLIEAEKEMSADVAYPEFNGEYLAILAAKAAGVSSIVIKDLPADKFLKAKIRARNFINTSVVEKPPEQTLTNS